MFSKLKRRRERDALPLLEFKRGDEQAYALIFKRFWQPLLRFVQSRVPDEETARELTQEAFLKAYRYRDNYETQHAFTTWLWTIARNTVTDHFRSAQGSSFRSEQAIGSPEELESPLHRADALLERKDERRAVLKMMRSLTRMQKRVLWLRNVHDFSYQEIAARLGLTIASVKNLALRAKAGLSENWDFTNYASVAHGI
jgi:RNA polymerase sigma-70 factor (ECF subfamily)